MDHPMRIAVFGSWRGPKAQVEVKVARGLEDQWSNKNSQEAFESACRDLGGEIARAGHTLVVASDSPSTVDFHIVQGVIAVKSTLQGTNRPIHVVRSQRHVPARVMLIVARSWRASVGSILNCLTSQSSSEGRFSNRTGVQQNGRKCMTTLPIWSINCS